MSDFNIDDLDKKIAALPREIAPGRDLWPEINAQLEPADNERKPNVAWRGWLSRLAFATIAASLIVAGIFLFRSGQSPGWDITALAGIPRIDAQDLNGTGKWHRGEWLETDADSRARLAVGNIGEVRLEPNSRLRLLDTAAGNHRLELARGTMHALIWAPPRLFFVETPSATAVDLGCAYTLNVDDLGAGTLRVSSGYVELDHGDRQVLIPAGLMCITRPDAGPGTPFAEATQPAFRDALQRFDFAADGARMLGEILARASAGDEITLWYLLARASAGERSAIFDKLTSFKAPPSGVTREGIVAGDKIMLSQWAAELGLTPAPAVR